jgi:hypothetical protein
VGTGAGTCTEALFTAAIAKGGIITFDCGGAATIPITSEKELVTSGDTTIDGGGNITLDGGGATRILHFNGGNYRVTKTVVTLQNLTLAHAKASGTKITAPASCSQGYEIDGGGGAVLINDGVLHVINCTFESNAAASPGPDVAGGGIYATGSLGVTIVGSTFVGNSASNGGAVGCLNSDLALMRRGRRRGRRWRQRRRDLDRRRLRRRPERLRRDVQPQRFRRARRRDVPHARRRDADVHVQPVQLRLEHRGAGWRRVLLPQQRPRHHGDDLLE